MPDQEVADDSQSQVEDTQAAAAAAESPTVSETATANYDYDGDISANEASFKAGDEVSRSFKCYTLVMTICNVDPHSSTYQRGWMDAGPSC
jgi:hypothetical protein